MKTINQTQIQRVLPQDWSINLPLAGGTTRLLRVAGDIAEEVRATVAGIFGMPFRHPLDDKGLERLGDHVLTDIGYERKRSR
jgi:hypothetical protein